jgi:putative tryptophan/tyrosine transport system substrate-binding protein
MDRRRFLLTSLAGAVAAPLAAAAQERANVPRVGVLGPGGASEMLKVQREPFEQGLRELGWKPGINVLLEYRYGGESPTQLGKLAAELVTLDVAVIVARGPVAIRAARQATAAIPIVMATTADPEGLGFVKSLARPGGNTTGIANLTWELDGKRLELLKEALPHLTRVAVLANPRNKDQFPAILGAAQAVGLQARVFEVSRPEEIGAVFELINKAQTGALLVATDIQVLEPSRARIVAMAARHRLPAMYPWGFYVDNGGLMAYSTSLRELHHRSAMFVDRILKGTKPADLPVEQPTKFELVINLKTAKALGLTIPPSLLVRADQVIE